MSQVDFVRDDFNKRVIFVFCLLYFFLPVIGIAFLFCCLFFQKGRYADKSQLRLLFIMLALFMAVVNVTKVPESDQVQYMDAYLLVPHQSIWQSLTNIYGERVANGGTTKEMGYGLLNIVGYVCSFGSYPLFVVEFTFLLYWIYFMAISRFFKAIAPHYSLTCILGACFILCFFTQFFNLTIHLQRQEIATAVMVYAIVDYSVTPEYSFKRFLVALFAVTLHTSVGLFLPIFLVKKFFKGKVGMRQLILVLAIVLVLLGLSNVLAASLLGSLGGQQSYALERMAGAGTSTESSFDISFILIFNVPLIFIAVKNIYQRRKCDSTSENVFFLSYLMVASFTLLTPDATMRYRFFMMSYAFWPFVLPLLVRKNGMLLKGYLAVIVIFLFFRFFITFDAMPWTYAPVEDVLTSNLFSLYLSNPF